MVVDKYGYGQKLNRGRAGNLVMVMVKILAWS